MNSTKRVLPMSWCVKISSAALGWAMSFVSNESRSLHALFLERIAHICENLEQLIYSLKEYLLRVWCLFVMVRMYNGLLGFGGDLVLGNEVAYFGTNYHPPSQCYRILGHANGSPVGLVVRLINDLCTTNAHLWNAWASWGCFSPSVDMSLRWMGSHRA